MSRSERLLGLDVGTVRIGVAFVDTGTRIAVPDGVISVDGTEVEEVLRMAAKNKVTSIIIGYPRNQSGEPTKQTELVEAFAETLLSHDIKVVFQDESLTSVLAEQRLSRRGKPFTKADVDSEAAAIILQDYVERNI